MWNLKTLQPIAAGLPVTIKTNWASYTAKLQKSEFGGYEFHVIGSNHRVQLTTVTEWSF